MATRVKIGFTHEKQYYKAGQIVNEHIANLYPENVKNVDVLPELRAAVQEVSVESTEEADEEPVEKPKKKAKRVRKSRK